MTATSSALAIDLERYRAYLHLLAQMQIDPRLRCRPIEGAAFTRRIGIIRLKNKTLSPAADAFIQMLTAGKGDQERAAPASPPRRRAKSGERKA